MHKNEQGNRFFSSMNIVFRRILIRLNLINFGSLMTLSSVYEQAIKKSYEGYALCKIKFHRKSVADLLFLNEHVIFGQILGLNNLAGKYISEILPGSKDRIAMILNLFMFDYQVYNNLNKEYCSKFSNKWYMYHIIRLKKGYIFVVLEDISKRKESELKFIETCNLLNSTLEATVDGIMVMSKEYEVIKYNNQFLKMHNISEAEMNRMNRRELIEFASKQMNDSEKFLEEIHMNALHPEIPVENLVEFRDGRKFLRHTQPMMLNEEITGRVFSFRDITEMKRSEEHIQILYRKLKLHIDNTPLAIIETDQNCRITGWSGSAPKIFGWTESEVIGKKINDFRFFSEPFFLKDGDDHGFNRFTQISHIENVRNYNKNEKLIWCEWFNSFELNHNGELVSVLSIVKDITEQILAEEQIQTIHQFNMQILNGAQEGIIVIDCNFIIRVWNPLMEILKGRNREEVLGKNLLEMFPYYKKECISENFTNALNGHTNTIEIYNSTGKILNMPVWTEEKIIPFVDISNRIVGIIVTVNDVTKAKSNEQELVFRLNKLTELNSKLAEYKFAVQELDQFTHLSSHQLQAPIRTISNYIKVINEDFGEMINEPMQTYLNTIQDSTKRMSSLIEVLADYSMIGQKCKIKKCSIKKLIDSVLCDISFSINTSGARINIGDMPEIHVYPVEFCQLLLNLLTNAIKFQENGKTPDIYMSSKRINHSWIFSVQDNGIGISPDYSSKIFEIFQRLHTEYEGKGIGLAYAKKIISLHGGEIWFESEQNRGTTFYFSIPDDIKVIKN
jgi:PAS domain S-box-containing protein